MSNPFTFRIFVPGGNPEGLRIFDKMNWTGKGLIFPREEWNSIKHREEFNQLGVYILYGYESYQDSEIDELPTVYIGQGDKIRNRIESHYQNKDFWNSCVVFVSTNDGLNRANITWLEYALITKAISTGRSRLDNANVPNEPRLTEFDKADTKSFLGEINQILPLAGIPIFEFPKSVNKKRDSSRNESINLPSSGLDTIIVAAREKNFNEMFLRQNCWFAIRISGSMLEKIKFIAAYQTYPLSAITHYAAVEKIEQYGDQGKFKVYFSESPKQLIPPIPLGANSNLSPQGPRYANLQKLRSAKSLSEI